jgi:hypothetical protein
VVSANGSIEIYSQANMCRSWYYLGSQAVSRELKFYDSDPILDLKIMYPNTSQPSIFESGMPTSRILTRMNSQFVDAVQGDMMLDKFRPTPGWDILGNLRIPSRPSAYADLAKLDKKGWWDPHWWREGHMTGAQTWASFIGVPFFAAWRWPHVDQDLDPKQPDSNPNNFPYGRWEVRDKIVGKGVLSMAYIHANCSYPKLLDKSLYPGVSPFTKTVLNTTNSTLPTIQISELWKDSTISSICNLTETRVKLEVLCTASGCTSTKAKESLGFALSSSIFKNRTAATLFLDNLQLSNGSANSDRADDAATMDVINNKWGLFEVWKQNPNPSSQIASHMTDSSSYNLERLLNTYLSLSQQILQDTSTNHLLDVFRGVKKDPRIVFATVKGAPYEPQYRLSLFWMIIDCIGCVVLLVAASAAIWLRIRTLAPDIFGYVSSLTRENPMITLPDGGSTLNGIDRARMLRGVKVRIADISGQDGVGRVGLAMKNSSQENVTELKKGKPYV